ncbi:lipocalin-like domain-containing protein [Dankookia rubra]|nr:lipocalin-like domain-containing protein [Dankookia rubra]
MASAMLRRNIMAMVGATISLLGFRTARAANAREATTSLIGTWKMVNATSRDPDGKALARPYGPKGMGLVTLNAEGRMMAVLCDGRAELPDGVRRDYASYCGNYTFDGTTLVTKVDASSTSRIAMGSDQVRKVRFEGNRLVLTPPPAEINGVLQHRDIFWERISTEPA